MKKVNRITKKFNALKKEGKKAFIAYITVGDPGLAATGDIVLALESAGADIIELGIPFSDPVADGPTIQAASQRSLVKGASLNKIFRMIKSLRSKTDIPVAFMTYYNPVFQHGVERFFRDCAGTGVDGVIVPDLPYDEGKDFIRAAKKNKIATIFLAAPTSTKERVKKIAAFSTGFIYYVSLTGVTGARNTVPIDIKAKIRSIKSFTDKPVAAGFGISNPKQASAVAGIADGVIVGSALVKIIENNLKDKKKLLMSISRFSASLAKAIHNA